MNKHSLRLWWAVKDSVTNLKGEPTKEQIHELWYVMGRLDWSLYHSIDQWDIDRWIKSLIKSLIDVGLNPVGKLEGIAELYEEDDEVG